MQFRTEKRLQRRASFQTRKGRCNTFNPRIELPKIDSDFRADALALFLQCSWRMAPMTSPADMPGFLLFPSCH